MIIQHPKFRSLAAYLLVALLVVGSPSVLQGVASGSAQITTTSGRPAIVVVGGPGGTRINTYNGNLFLPRVDLQIPGRGMPLEIELTYNANQSGFSGPFGFGWRLNYGIKCLFSGSNIIVQWGDGRNDLFVNQGGVYTPANGGIIATLQQVGTTLQLINKNRVKFVFNASSGLLQQIQDPNGNTLTFSYSGALLTVVTDASGRNLSLSYDANGRVTTITDGNVSPPRTIQYLYDGFGHHVGVIDPLGDATTYNYDATHHLTAITDSLGVTRVTYGGAKMLVTGVSRFDPAGAPVSARTFNYDTANTKTTVTDDVGGGAQASTIYEYDANRRLIRLTDPLGHVRTMTYDASGNLSAITNGAGETMTYANDENGNVLTATDPLGNSASWTYHPTFDFVTSFTDGNGHTIHFNYDANGNLVSRSDATGNVTEYTYNEFGQQITRKNARGFITTFAYDANGNRTSVTDPLGRKVTALYDGAGRMLTTTDGNGKNRSFSYNAANQVTGISFSDGTTASFNYNEAGKLVHAVDPNTDLTFSYNAAGLPVQVADHKLSKTIGYEYDRVGNRVRMTGPTGAITRYVYDIGGRLVSTERNGQEFSLSYDQANRLTDVILPNGATTAHNYNAAGRLLSISHNRSDGGVISSYSYQYDAGGRQTQLTLASGDQVSYSYDGNDRLTAETRTGVDSYDHRFAYDAVGNRTQLDADGTLTSYSYDQADQLTLESTGDATTSYAYDGNGNRTQKLTGATVLNHTYDGLDRLTGFSDSGTGVTSSYSYDVFGRRIAKTVGETITRFVYDDVDAVAEYDGTGTLQAENWYGLGVDNNIARIAGGGVSYYLHDRLNSVRQLIDDAGAVRNSYDYDAWGNTRSSVENVTNPTTYAGRERDSESGLYFYRARSYDAGTGRFIQQDPVDDNSGRSLSVYVDNNPTNATDPSGAVPFWIPAVIAIVVIVSWPSKLGNDELPPQQLPNPQIQQLQQQVQQLQQQNQQLQQQNQQLQQQVQQLQQQMQQMQQQMNDLKKQNQELIDLLKQRMEMDKLKKNGQRGGANVPGGGNEAASSGIDGGYGSGTINCISTVTRISTVPIIGEPVRVCDIRLPVPTPF
jgi:RHS repeat-associated protein